MGLRIGLLTIGDELLSGEICDTNTQSIANALSSAGYRLVQSVTVGDDENAIV